MSLALLQSVWFLSKAILLASLIEFRIIKDRQKGLTSKLEAGQALGILATEYGVIDELNRMLPKHIQVANSKEKLPLRFNISGVPITRRVGSKKNRSGGNPISVRVRVMRLRHDIYVQQRNLFLKLTGMSMGEYYFLAILNSFMVPFLRIRGISEKEMGVINRIVPILQVNPVYLLVNRKKATAAFYIAALESMKCCKEWSQWSENRLREDFTRFAAIFDDLRDKSCLGFHLLHCTAARKGWVSRKSGKGVSGHPYAENIGEPFEVQGKGLHGLRRPGTAFVNFAYGLNDLQKLAHHVGHGYLKKDFMLRCVLDFGIFCSPEDYANLQKLILQPTLKPNALRKAAWLFHQGVPIEDMPLCAALLPYTETFRQAKELARVGVLPELLDNLHECELLPLHTAQIRYVHERCGEADMDQVLMLLKAGLQPELLRIGLLLLQEFQEREPEIIVDAIAHSYSLDEARMRMQNRHGSSTIAEVQVRPQRPIRISKKTASKLEQEVVRGTKLDERPLTAFPYPWFFNQRQGVVISRFRNRLQWDYRVNGPHIVIRRQDGSASLRFSKGKGDISAYLLRKKFREAGITMEEAQSVLDV